MLIELKGSAIFFFLITTEVSHTAGCLFLFLEWKLLRSCTTNHFKQILQHSSFFSINTHSYTREHPLSFYLMLFSCYVSNNYAYRALLSYFFMNITYLKKTTILQTFLMAYTFRSFRTRYCNESVPDMCYFSFRNNGVCNVFETSTRLPLTGEPHNSTWNFSFIFSTTPCSFRAGDGHDRKASRFPCPNKFSLLSLDPFSSHSAP